MTEESQHQPHEERNEESHIQNVEYSKGEDSQQINERQSDASYGTLKELWTLEILMLCL